MANNDAELMRQLVNSINGTPQPENIDEALMPMLARISKMFDMSSIASSIQVQSGTRKLNNLWNRAMFVKHKGGYSEVTWLTLLRFLGSNAATRINLGRAADGSAIQGRPLNMDQIQQIVSDQRIRAAIFKEFKVNKVNDPRNAPLDRTVPRSGDLAPVRNQYIGGDPRVGTLPPNDPTRAARMAARAKRAEIVCLTILEAAVIEMIQQGEGVSVGAGGGPATRPTPAPGSAAPAAAAAPTPAAPAAAPTPAAPPTITPAQAANLRAALGITI